MRIITRGDLIRALEAGSQHLIITFADEILTLAVDESVTRTLSLPGKQPGYGLLHHRDEIAISFAIAWTPKSTEHENPQALSKKRNI